MAFIIVNLATTFGMVATAKLVVLFALLASARAPMDHRVSCAAVQSLASPAALNRGRSTH